MADPTNLFPIIAGSRVKVHGDYEGPQWGFNYFSDKNLTSIALDVSDDPGMRYDQWYIVDTNNDGRVDFALVNLTSYSDYKDCKTRALEQHPEDPHPEYRVCYQPTTLFLPTDAVQDKVVTQLLSNINPDTGSAIRIVKREDSPELAEAQATFDRIMATRQQLKQRFLAKASYGWFDGQVEWLQDPKDEVDSGADHLEINGYRRGAEVCFNGSTDESNPVLEGTVDGVSYMFPETAFTESEVRSVCKRIESHKSCNNR